MLRNWRGGTTCNNKDVVAPFTVHCSATLSDVRCHMTQQPLCVSYQFQLQGPWRDYWPSQFSEFTVIMYGVPFITCSSRWPKNGWQASHLATDKPSIQKGHFIPAGVALMHCYALGHAMSWIVSSTVNYAFRTKGSVT
jgi:hypothetical protein